MAEEGLAFSSLSIAKRKPSGPPADIHVQADSKRIRLENGNGSSLEASSSNEAFCLPAEIWHRIFSLVPPKSLGSLLRVNKLFHGFLDPPRGIGHVRPTARHACPSVLPPMKPDAIWQASRELFWPQMPSPLRGKTELDMWRLCCSKSCQFCGAPRPADGGEQRGKWRLGPGADGVAPLFPFAFVSCAKCLPDVLIKESDLLLSNSTPFFLTAGLPVAFLSAELHVIPHEVLSSGKDPLHSEVNKVFSSDQVKAITAEFEAVRALGQVLTSGWARGLEARGKIAFADHIRFEKWLMCGGVHKMRTCLESTLSSTRGADKGSSANGVTRGQALLNVSQSAQDIVMTDSGPPTSAEAVDPTSLRSESSNAIQDSIRISRAHSKSLEEVAKNHKTVEKATIASTAGTSDQKALHPLQVSDERVANDQGPGGHRALPTPEVRGDSLSNTKKSPQSILSCLADEIIQQRWGGGEGLTIATAPGFAVNVLLEVRKKFYSRKARDEVAKSLGLERKCFTPKLTLTDMRWIFATKITPYTDAYFRELFWCSECKNQTKPFMLESVIQHYAAKHTETLSAGTTVVQWQAEWPEKPIFDPNPSKREYKKQTQAATKASGQTTAVTDRVREKAVVRASARLSSGNHPSGLQPPQHGGSNAAGNSNVELANTLPAGFLSQSQYRQRLALMTKSWNEMSKEVAQIRGLPSAATACLLLHHLGTVFQSQFGEPAFFTMFRDCLYNQKDMHFARKIKCLQCRACALTHGSEEDRKFLTLHSLADHFHAKHTNHFDWRFDMVSAPEGQASPELRWSLAQHPVVLQLTTRAIPWFVPRESLIDVTDNAARTANGNKNMVVQSPNLPLAHAAHGPEPPLRGQSLRVSDPRSVLDTAPGAMRLAGANVLYDIPAESYYGIKREPSSAALADTIVHHRSVGGRGVDGYHLAYAYSRPDPQTLDSQFGYHVPTQAGGAYRLDDVRDRRGDHLVQRPMQHDGARLSSHPAGFVELRSQAGHREASRVQPSAAFGRDYEDYDPRYPAADNCDDSLPN
ncbi:hypothetical protein CP533_4449 [Ophiocordyceps camponoti-saundersi (nom. inval.)]|nr:hypothetical protein CP533_4449 [Ophiocordyceps camponoti-saundersi (nom. inval.)]